MEPSLDHWTSIFLIAAAQGLFLGFIMVFKKEGLRQSNLLLASVIFLFTFMLFYYVSYWTGYLRYLPRFTPLLGGLTFLIAPLLYFYLRSLDGIKLTAKDALHVVPFAIYVLFQTSLWFLLSVFDVSRPTWHVVISAYQSTHLLVYACLIFFISSRFKIQKDNERKSAWAIKLSYANLGYTLSYVSYHLMVWTGTLSEELDYTVSFSMSFFIYFVGYTSFNYPNVITHSTTEKKYRKSPLTPVAAEHIAEKLEQYIDQHKSFLNGDLRLKDIADELNLSTHVLSQVINEQFDQSFSDFINMKRVEEAKRLLTDPGKVNEKIIGIAYDCGFNNKTSFNNAFKKFTGVSPSAYQKAPSHQKIGLTHQS